MKKEPPVGGSGEETGSFVGQVVAIIETIAARAEDTLARAVTGNHIPLDSDEHRLTPPEGGPGRDVGMSKQKGAAPSTPGTSAGSRNRGGGEKTVRAKPGAVPQVPRPLQRRVRQRKGTPPDSMEDLGSEEALRCSCVFAKCIWIRR